MARVAITEYAVKKLFLGDAYNGFTATKQTIGTLQSQLSTNTQYVVKVDSGVKKRALSGLLVIGIGCAEVVTQSKKFFAMGYERVIVEKVVPHQDVHERYISIDLIRDGALLLHSKKGGVAIEKNSRYVSQTHIPLPDILAGTTNIVVDRVDVSQLLMFTKKYHVSFLEINPYVIIKKRFIPLDMAAEIDSVKRSLLPTWAREHILDVGSQTKEEQEVAELNTRSQATFSVHVLNKDGSIATLLSGGGASLVVIDTLLEAGLKDEIINYSEYSGAPTYDETRRYAEVILSLLSKSQSRKKTIVIAGGVSNFTDIMETFGGIIAAFSENLDILKSEDVFVCVRRGGVNQAKGLQQLREFLEKNNISHKVYGPEFSLGKLGELTKTHT